MRKLSTNRREKIVFVGEKPTKSAPSLELGKMFISKDYDVKFLYNLDLLSTYDFIRQITGAIGLILVDYNLVPFRLRQLCLARLIGVPIIKWWVGTDVYNIFYSKKLQLLNKMLSSFVLNVAVSPHLVDELSDIGIKSIFIPSVVYEPSILPSEYNFGSSVLVYLPTNRKSFYSFDLIVSLVEKFVDIDFIIIADEEHSLSKYSNVYSLGWVEEMSLVWPKVGCLLRVTEHDGLPRMVISALRRKKYVIYSWPLDGCWLAKNYEECSFYLRKFRSLSTYNKKAEDALQKILDNIPPEEKFLSIIYDKYGNRFNFLELMRALNIFLRFTMIKES